MSGLAARPALVSAALLYFLVVLAVGLGSAWRTRTAKDFFLAGQRLGLGVTSLATFATAFSGFTFLGGPGLAYRIGLASLWIVIPISYTSGLLCWVLGRRLRSLAGRREIYTVPDAIAWRFASRPATAVASLAIVAGVVAYLGSQLLALGVLVQATFGVERLAPALACGAAVLVAYGVAGGMVAGVYTDVVQGGVMLGTALFVFARVLALEGGLAGLTRSIAASHEFGRAFLEPLGTLQAPTAFGFLFVFGVGVLGQPHLLHKFYMIDDPHKLRFLPLALGASQVLCLLLWVGVGLTVPALVARGELAPLARPDEATPLFLATSAGDVLAGLAVAGVLAAIMSTASSLMNIGAAALVRDLPRALGRPLRRELAWTRLMVLLLTAAAAALAYVYDDLIALLGTFAFGTFAATLAPTLAVGLCWERVTARAATCSMVTGLVLSVGLELAGRYSPTRELPFAPGAPPAALALAASFLMLCAVSWATRPVPVAPEVRELIAGDDL